jgi:hypothetical protein
LGENLFGHRMQDVSAKRRPTILAGFPFATATLSIW